MAEQFSRRSATCQQSRRGEEGAMPTTLYSTTCGDGMAKEANAARGEVEGLLSGSSGRIHPDGVRRLGLQS